MLGRINIANSIEKGNPMFLARCLLALYQQQTQSEKEAHSTLQLNGVGFSAYDASFGSKLALQAQHWADTLKDGQGELVLNFPGGQRKLNNYKEPLTDGQVPCAQKLLRKYVQQLDKLLNG